MERNRRDDAQHPKNVFDLYDDAILGAYIAWIYEL